MPFTPQKELIRKDFIKRGVKINVLRFNSGTNPNTPINNIA